jgi:hypothetical protein
MTRDDIARVMEELPTLTAYGMGVFSLYKLPPDAIDDKLDRGRESLLAMEERCTRICEWLADIRPIKTINLNHTSYGLKHIAEPEIGYTTNGAFIAAAVHCGFPYRTRPDSPNVCFGMSERSITEKIRIEREIRNRPG